MIMSPFVLDRNVPEIGPPGGGQIGANGDEQEGIEKGGSAGAGEERGTGSGGCSPAPACELPASEALVEALSGRRRGGVAASQRRAAIESRTRCEVSAESAAAGAGEVRWSGRRALRAHAGGGTSGIGRRFEDRRGNAAAVDAGGGIVEPRAKAAAPSPAARAQGTFWRTGANGRKLSRLAGGARAGRLLDRHGGRCHQSNAGPTGRARNHLGGGGCLAQLDGALWSPAGAVRGLEESVQTSGQRPRTAARRRAHHAVWAHVREAGDRVDRREFSAGQGARRAGAWHASGPAGEKAAAQRDL